MRIWCIPKSTSLESPCLPPRIDRDVFIRSPPPPPRLSKQEKLARGVIVYKTRKTRMEKGSKPPFQSSTKIKPTGRKVRYADQEEEKLKLLDNSQAPTKEEYNIDKDLAPYRGEIVHSRQQSNTSGTSSCLGTGSSSTTSPGSVATSPQYSSSSGRGSSADNEPEGAISPSPTSHPCDISFLNGSSSPQSTLTSLTSYKSRRSDRSNTRSSKSRVKKTVTRSTLSLSVGGFSSKRGPMLADLKKSSSCDDGNVILYPGISRTRERRNKEKIKPRQTEGVYNGMLWW